MITAFIRRNSIKFLKDSAIRFSRSFSILIIIFSLMISSCENKLDLIPKSDLLTLPSQTAKDFKTIYTDSGRVQLIMTSPLMEQYDNNKEPYKEFIYGIHLDYYDGNENPVASVSAKYARHTQSNNLWELRDSVVIINEENEKLETELLFWDQNKDLIYSDRFVKITNVDQIVMGTGFESDSKLQRRRIRKVSATIYLKDEE
jgi:LPS export ABC transporter protein LptC